MPSSLRPVGLIVLLGLAAAIPVAGLAQTGFTPAGQNYAIAGSLPGDQVFPSVALNASGGYIVWQDAYADGDGLGISARRLNNSLSGDLATFRINVFGAGDQQQPQVAMLNDDGAVFVWQSRISGVPAVFARFLSPSGTFLTGDVPVSGVTHQQEVQPAVAVMTDGNVVVVWTRFNGADMQDVFAQRFSPLGEKLGSEFRVTSFVVQNQRRPSVAALANGNFVVAWVTEFISNTRVEEFSSATNAVTASAIVYCRVFNGAGVAVTSDQRASLSSEPFCANPAVAGVAGGGFSVVWNQKHATDRQVSWDIFARRFTEMGVAVGDPFRVNQGTFGDQYAPGIAGVGTDQCVVWTSLGQDGSYEGVYGRFLVDGAPNGGEFLVNTNNTISRQMHPSVASDQAGRFLVAWTSFVGGGASFDLYAQRFIGSRVTHEAPAPPYVFALSSSQLEITWPELAGYYSLQNYELYIGNNPTPIALTQNYYVLSGLVPGAGYYFYLAYHFADGSRSPLSLAAKANTWGSDGNFDGLPDTWQQIFWGPNPALWPSPNADSDADGANNLNEFLTGTNPVDANSVLRTRLRFTATGGRLSWNTEAGFIYQVQKSAGFSGWTDYGSPRFAAGLMDSVSVDALDRSEFYRVIRVR